jgi:hypothetical protein
MAQSVEINCIYKTPRMDPHERIQSVGGTNGNGTRWKMSQPDAVARIEAGKWEFYVTRGGRTVRVIIARSAHGHKYLKTENDGVQPDDLLSLPECP